MEKAGDKENGWYPNGKPNGMDKADDKENGWYPNGKPNGNPEQAKFPKAIISSRHGFGSSGRHIPLLTNNFKVSINVPNEICYQYTVSITSKDKRVVEDKALGRKLIDRLYQKYYSVLADKKFEFAYDGKKCLYTVGCPLSQNHFEFTVDLEESFAKVSPAGIGNPNVYGKLGKLPKCSFQSKTFKVELSYCSEIALESITLNLQGSATNTNVQDALKVLDVTLRQQAVKRGSLMVKQSFFPYNSRNLVDVGGGVTGIRGFHSSFRPTHGGLSLNMDVSTTLILKPGPVLDFLMDNQNVREARDIDWVKAKRMLKNLRIRTRYHKREFKIIGLSEKPCNQQYFPLKVRNSDGAIVKGQTELITVYEYFAEHRNIELTDSAYMPCLDVGKPELPNYLPLELCFLLSLQRYTKALSSMQRASLVEKSRQKPRERIQTLTDAVRNYSYDKTPMLVSCGITIDRQLTAVDGRVLETPKLKVGNNEYCVPHNGRWNFNNKTLLNPIRVNRWAVVNFSACCDTSHLTWELIDSGRNKGIHIEHPFPLIEEDPQSIRANPVARVEKMFGQLLAKASNRDKLELVLCVLPERKNSDIYGPWKKKLLSEYGIATQCISPIKINDQYLTNVLLKINSKLGGINSLLATERPSHIPFIKDTPTMILGMAVSHGSPGQLDISSIAAVVGSCCWPLISRYRAAVRTQSHKAEMIDALYKPSTNGINDDGIIRELLLNFYTTSKGCKPTQIIIFRDGVSESQFYRVLNIELEQIRKAYQHLDEINSPKFTVIVAQKSHHTKLFQANGPKCVPPGTVVDTKIVHPRNYDFFMSAHAEMIGTPRLAHYHVLVDEIGFSPDELQNFIHSLSYVYQRSTRAISIAAPICYARRAAHQMGQFMKFENLSETCSGQRSVTSVGSIPVPVLPRLHEDVEGSMFFC